MKQKDKDNELYEVVNVISLTRKVNKKIWKQFKKTCKKNNKKIYAVINEIVTNFLEERDIWSGIDWSIEEHRCLPTKRYKWKMFVITSKNVHSKTYAILEKEFKSYIKSNLKQGGNNRENKIK